VPNKKDVVPQLYATIAALHKMGGIYVDDPSSSAKFARRTRRMTTDIYDILRQEILYLTRQPGSQINENQICHDLQVSRTPVREAILKLQDEGLVEIFPQSGTRVAPISLAGLPDIVFYRAALESQSVRDLVSVITTDKIKDLHKIIDEQEYHARHLDHEKFHLSDEKFHESLLIMAKRQQIWKAINREKADLDRFRMLTLPIFGRMMEVAQDHRNIINSIESKDVDGSVEMLKNHLENVLDVVNLIKEQHKPLVL